MKHLKKVAALLALAVLLVPTMGAVANEDHTIHVALQPVGGSGVTGAVNLVQLSQERGTHINLVAFGLEPGSTHVSLYYDNHQCDLEPYSEDDIIGGPYTANQYGVGTTQGKVDDNLDEINSVSVRDAGTFTLLACADVHP